MKHRLKTNRISGVFEYKKVRNRSGNVRGIGRRDADPIVGKDCWINTNN